MGETDRDMYICLREKQFIYIFTKTGIKQKFVHALSRMRIK